MGRGIACAGAVVLDEQARLLLVRRRNDPGAGLWSIPGGKCRLGESFADACVRETAEETGLTVRIVRPVGTAARPGLAGDWFEIHDFLCQVIGGSLVANDDASDAGWFTGAEVLDLALVEGLADALRGWGCFPG